MTEQELAALEALFDAATTGPWGCAPNGRTVCCVDSSGVPLARTGQRVAGDMFPQIGHAYLSEDANFIAAARSALPALIAEVRRLQAAPARAGGVIEQLQVEREEAQRDDG